MEDHECLVAQEEPGEEPLREQESGKDQASCRSRLQKLGIAAALLGCCLALASFAMQMPGRKCSDVVLSAELSKRVPWTGKRRGSMERRLNVVTVQEAQQIVVNFGRVFGDVTAETTKIANAFAAESEPAVDPKRVQDRAEARCILGTLAVAEGLAKIGTNLQSSKAVCSPDPIFSILPGKFGKLVRGLKAWVCAINIELVIAGWLGLASGLAGASVTCSIAANATTSLKQDQQLTASCTSAGFSMVSLLISLAGSLQLSIVGCEIVAQHIEEKLSGGLNLIGASGPANFGKTNVDPSKLKQMSEALYKQLSPDNFGSDTGTAIAPSINAAGASAAAAAFSTASATSGVGAAAAAAGPVALGRRLFLGGGPENIMTQCVVDIAQALTQLALMGVTMDSLANADCRNPFLGITFAKAIPKPIRSRVENSVRAACALGINGVLANLGVVVVFLSFTSFHCTNQANVKAICGAGVAGIEAGLAGLAGSGAAAYIACTEGGRINKTTALITKFTTDYLNEAAEDVVQETCPDLSLECFTEFAGFFANCPVGSTVPGPVTAQCPRLPTRDSCPGIQHCRSSFNLYRQTLIQNGDVWFPALGSQEFVDLVDNANPCFQYLTCFLNYVPPTRRLQNGSYEKMPESPDKLFSDGMRTLLLQKIFGPDPEHWRKIADGEIQGKPMSEVPKDHSLQLHERLWASIGKNLSNMALEVNESIQNLSASLLRANEEGQAILEQVSKEIKKKQEAELCAEEQEFLVDDHQETMP
ncbi:unnamed protein product [Effrenium voratum]|uniref:Uncharacterized protein n=1 Tax=Effrenium voratum TaxID=2562239 RepID=A0AA36INZ2_9DINO|nr:unnamed protein product [Effrenium voratum]